MDTYTVLIIAVPALIILGAVVLFTTTRRRDAARVGRLSGETRSRDRSGVEQNPDAGRALERSVALERRKGEIEPVKVSTPEPWVQPDPELIGVNRRQFFNRSMVGLMGLSVGTFSAASLAFLWPQEKGGFGAVIDIGSIKDIDAQIDSDVPSAGFAYFPEARAYVQRFPADALDSAREVYAPAIVANMEAGYLALWQKCPHLGCKVPDCGTSQWFECPCHGSQYNNVGEKKAGPTPRGMDAFPISFVEGNMLIDTGTIVTGQPPGTNTTGQPAEGPHCLSGEG
ncbi:MAG: ubiquinol-cytochrome c reductase iron-sulfur subunit [Acidimicrobiales bacterium]